MSSKWRRWGWHEDFLLSIGDGVWQTAPMMWFYNNEAEADGPHDESGMSALVRSGRIHAQTLVWQDGMDLWCEAGSLNPGWWQSAMADSLPARRHHASLTPVESAAESKIAGLLKRFFGSV